MLTKRQFVAEQLRGLAPDAEWNMEGIDRADELAGMLVRAGVTDLWALRLTPVTVVIPGGTFERENEAGTILETFLDREESTYAFDYYGRRIGYLGTPDRNDNEATLRKTDMGFMLAWSAEGHGNVSYYLKASPQKTLQIVPVWGSSSDTADARLFAKAIISFVISAYLPMVGVNIGQAVGSAVVSAEFAAAYPAVTTAIGNVAVSAALNGGDIESAVKSVALSSFAGMAGGQVGDMATFATDSEMVGKLAAVATKTAIIGGDIKRAVSLELLAIGASNMGADDTVGFDFFAAGGPVSGEFDFSNISMDGGFNMNFDPGAYSFDMNGYDFGFDAGYFDNLGNLTFEGDFADGLPQIEYVIPTLPPLDIPAVEIDANAQATPGGDPVVWSPFSFNVDTSAYGPTTGGAPPGPSAPARPDSPSYSPTTVIQGVTAAALAALNLVKAYRSLDQPTVQTTARAVRADGSVAVVGNNGLIQTRTAGGAVVASRPPVGVPQATLDGNFVVNNGDGTYTVVSPQGQSQTLQYSGTAAQGAAGPNWWLIGGGVVVAALLLRRNR